MRLSSRIVDKAKSSNATSVLLLANVLVLQIIFLAMLLSRSSMPSLSSTMIYPSDFVPTFTTGNSDVLQQHLLNPLNIPPGSPPNLPSVRIESADDAENVDVKRRIYGGAGDKKHLGGFTQLDLHGISPNLWTNMILKYGVHSFLDVGCGRGVSTRWFLEHKARVLCVEGSHDAVTKSILPADVIVEHDFSRGPWWPAETFDAAWSVEFLEHVSLQYHYNYISTLRKAALIFVSSSRWGGWHHVEVHPDSWWIRKYELYGFKYDDELTKQARQWAAQDYRNSTNVAPNGKNFGPQHLSTSLKVFVNPAVAALPQHQHLFMEHGCFQLFKEGTITNRPCAQGTRAEAELETALPESFHPLPVLPEMHQRWNDIVKSNLDDVQEQ